MKQGTWSCKHCKSKNFSNKNRCLWCGLTKEKLKALQSGE